MKHWIVAGFLFGFGIAAAGPAAHAQNFERAGLYLGGSWFRLGEQFGNDLNREIENGLALSDVNLSVGDTSGVGAVLGVRAGSWFGLELAGERYRTLHIDLDAAGLTARGDLDVRTAMLLGKLYLLGGRIQPYLLAGAGYIQGRFDVAGENAVGHAALGRGGAGLELYLSRNWAVDVQAAYSRGLTSDLKDLAFFTVGGSFLFRF